MGEFIESYGDLIVSAIFVLVLLGVGTTVLAVLTGGSGI